MTASSFELHNHDSCVTTALREAEATCAREGVRLTPIRRRVLEILLETHEAMGAYDVLARLADEGLGSKPPVAYRALNFLVKHSLAHRIERLNAFVACSHPGHDHDPAFMICRSCKTVSEATATRDHLYASASAAGFIIEQTVIEAEGLCPKCQTSSDA